MGKILRGAHKGGLKPQIFRENRGEILPAKSGLFGANRDLFRAYRRLFGADRDQFLRTPQPRGKSKNCPERALFGPIGAFWAKPPFAKPPFGFPRMLFLGTEHFCGKVDVMYCQNRFCEVMFSVMRKCLCKVGVTYSVRSSVLNQVSNGILTEENPVRPQTAPAAIARTFARLAARGIRFPY